MYNTAHIYNYMYMYKKNHNSCMLRFIMRIKLPTAINSSKRSIDDSCLGQPCVLNAQV